jgi:hypothetical protein
MSCGGVLLCLLLLRVAAPNIGTWLSMRWLSSFVCFCEHACGGFDDSYSIADMYTKMWYVPREQSDEEFCCIDVFSVLVEAF